MIFAGKRGNGQSRDRLSWHLCRHASLLLLARDAGHRGVTSPPGGTRQGCLSPPVPAASASQLGTCWGLTLLRCGVPGLGEGGPPPPGSLGIVGTRFAPCCSQNQTPKPPILPLLHARPSKNPPFRGWGAGRQLWNGGSSGDGLSEAAVGGPPATAGPSASPALTGPHGAPRAAPQTQPAAAAHRPHSPVPEPAALEEQVAAGHRPDLARLLQPATAPGAG